MMMVTMELAAEVGVRRACQALGVPPASYYSHQSPRSVAKPAARVRPPSPRALTTDEEQEVLAVLHDERFVDRSPAHIVAALLDAGTWLCSERTMYRILTKWGEVKERRNLLRHPRRAVPRLRATSPNQVWTWDTTRIRGVGKGKWYYLYVLLDLYSRKVVGWTFSRRLRAVIAAHLLEQTLMQEGVLPETLTIHNDRGSEFVAKDIVTLMESLDLIRSLSRPRTSNDNAYSESAFKTLKYDPRYPGFFWSFEPAWAYFEEFFNWYNEEHRHSGIAYLTPNVVHAGQGAETLERRAKVKQAAFERTPDRFVRGSPTLPKLPEAVWINWPGPTSDEESKTQ